MTPYDTALRIQRREVDAVRVRIGVAIGQCDAIRSAEAEIEAKLMRERRAAEAQWWAAADRWRERVRRDRARLADEAVAAETRLERLRAEAAEAYGAMRVIEQAAERFREEEERAIATAEQAAIDDLSAARLARAPHRHRRVA